MDFDRGSMAFCSYSGTVTSHMGFDLYCDIRGSRNGFYSRRVMKIIRALERFIEWGDDIIDRAERGEWQASWWLAFSTLTGLSFVILVFVAILMWVFP